MTRLNVTFPSLEQLERCRQLADAEDAEKAEHARLAAKRETDANLAELRAILGPRYERCSIRSFFLYGDDDTQDRQSFVQCSVDALLCDVRASVQSGQPVTFTGPCGTGKDHLLATMAMTACQAGVSVLWGRGWQVAGFVAKLEKEKFLKSAMPKGVICVSDPIERADLIPSERPSFATLVDLCYSFRRPIWVSMNARSEDDAMAKYGTRVVDRLRHEGLMLECYWESYRGRRN